MFKDAVEFYDEAQKTMQLVPGCFWMRQTGKWHHLSVVRQQEEITTCWNGVEIPKGVVLVGDEKEL